MSLASKFILKGQTLLPATAKLGRITNFLVSLSYQSVCNKILIFFITNISMFFF